jgi:hypothetical protein
MVPEETEVDEALRLSRKLRIVGSRLDCCNERGRTVLVFSK